MNYKTLARRYRPQTFREVLGQDAITRTLKNAIASGRIAHAYLFSGSRGTGKTTTARIFAKALNCPNRTADFEPCNTCTSCVEITAGRSLDVLEVDGASHRGIEDIRQINDTAGYSASAGGYKIYIIDEVHMLTKEAFNALLKTLEEPPAQVLFLFATTEPHKVLPTIVSRCQRYHLSRIPTPVIEKKLAEIAADLGIAAEPAALRLIARMADGGLRDAESLLDQVIAFEEGKITEQSVAEVLGVVSSDIVFSLDQAVKDYDLAAAFEISHTLFSSGKDLSHFIETLIEHYRTLLLLSLSSTHADDLSPEELARYKTSASIYRTDHCQTILDLLLQVEEKIRFSPSAKTLLESTLLKIIRTPKRVPVDFLVKKLMELEGAAPGPQKPIAEAPAPAPKKPSMTEDPVPLPKEIPPNKKKEPPPPAPSKDIPKKSQVRYDTLVQFAAVELEGKVERKK